MKSYNSALPFMLLIQKLIFSKRARHDIANIGRE